MGAFYGCIHVKDAELDAVRAALQALSQERGTRFYFGPQGGGVAVFPSEAGQDLALGEALARRVGGKVLHLLVHDSDVFAYQLYDAGTCTDRHCSQPAWVDADTPQARAAWSGQPAVVARAWDLPAAARALARALEDAADLQEERYARFARALKLGSVGASYESLEALQKRPRGLEHVPASEAPAVKKKSANAALRDDVKALTAAGTLRGSAQPPAPPDGRWAPTPSAVACAGGAFGVAWDGRWTQEPLLERWAPPFRAPDAVRLPLPAQAPLVAADAQGRRALLASPAGGDVHVVDLSDGRTVSTWQTQTRGAPYALAADGARVLAGEEDGVVCRDAATGRVEGRLALGLPAHRLALHPSGAWALVHGHQQPLRVLRLPALQPHRALALPQEPRFGFFVDLAVMTLGFTQDGAWLLCGTDAGLRVYAWDEVLAATGTLPAPRWSAAVGEPHPGLGTTYCYTAVHDAARGRVLFGGTSGRVHALDLGSGAVRDLLVLPGEWTVLDLHVSGDGRTLAARERPPITTKRDERPWTVRFYDLERLG